MTANPCRLSIHRGPFVEAELEGSPAGLRSLASALSRGRSTSIELSTPGASVVQEINASPLLKVAAGPGLTLHLSGSLSALDLVWSALSGTAQAAEEATDRTVKRHTHIEYLGEGDGYRHPDSVPLAIGSDWPDS